MSVVCNAVYLLPNAVLFQVSTISACLPVHLVGNRAFDAHEEYNPVTGQWRSLSAITTARHGAAFGTIDDVTYVAGGGPLAGSSFSTTVEAFTL